MNRDGNRESGGGSRKPFWYLRRSVKAEVDEELNAHLEMRVDELIAAGLSREEARREALRQFGDLEATRRYCRQQDETKETVVQRSLMFQDFLQDLRISVRSLIRVPMLALTIVATVGVGIGATAAIFSAINAAMLRPLPYAHADRLVRVYTDTPPFKFRFSAVDYLAFTEQQTRFEQHATYTDRAVSFSNGEIAEVLRTRVVSWAFFSLLGVNPVIGRDFSEQDGRAGSPPVVLASHAFWQQRLGGRADSIGKPIRLDGADYTVVGVVPPGVGPLDRRYDLFVIQQFTPPRRKGPFFYSVIARLPEGADRALAARELGAINRALFPIWKSSYQDEKSTWSMEDLKTNLVGDVGTLAGLSLAAVAMVWLIACANASNLLIARITGRRQELAVRAALGASRGRVIRDLLAESLLLATAAAVVAIGIASGGIQLLQVYGAAYFPRTGEISFDAPVMWLMAALALASALLFGLVPAIHGTGGSVDASLRSSRSSTASIGVRRLRRALVGAQFAIATPLLIVAGLLLASLNELRRVDLGFDSARVLTGSIRLPSAQYQDAARISAFWDELRRRVAALPGVAGVASADSLPPNQVGQHNNFDLEERPAQPGQSQPVTPWAGISPGYVPTLGLKLVEGRLLDERDAQAETLPAVMVDRAWARRFFPNESAVGKRLRSGGCTDCPWTTVVGVLSEVKYEGLEQSDQGTVYWPINAGTARFLIVRTTADPLSVAPAVREAVRSLEPAAPMTNIATVGSLVDQSLLRPQSLSLLVASFAGVALLLSIIGIYGVMGYYVQQHLKEIGIRIALGGNRGDVARLVIGQGMTVVVAGVIAGTAVAFAATRLMASLLFGVGAADPRTFAAVAVLMLSVALVACAVPAWRAMRLQPAAVLRNE